MAKAKGGKKNKSAKSKAKKAKSAPKTKKAKGLVVKTPKLKSKKEEALAPAVASEVKAVVVETTKEEMDATTSAPTQPVVARAQPAEPDAIDLMAKDLNKTVLSHTRGITKSMLEDYLKKLPKNAPYYIVPNYNGNTFTIDITDGTKKVTIPSQGTYPLAG